MRRLTASSLVTLGLLSVSSCTAVQNLSQFEEDTSCGVDIRLRGFFPHAQEPGSDLDISELSAIRERFGVYVVQDRLQPSGEFQRFYFARAFFEPLPSPDVDIRIPFAVEASQTREELPATLELHGDRQTLRDGADFFEISTIPADHSWAFPHACSEEGTVFQHTTDFDQLEEASEQAYELKLRPATPEDAQFWVNNTIEVRVVREAIIDGVEVNQARAFYRRGNATDIADATIDDAEIDMGGVLRETEDVSVIVFVDRNGDGNFDVSTDVALETTLELDRAALPRCDDAAPPCLDIDAVVLEFTLDGISPTGSTLIDGPWWNHSAP